MPTARSIDRKLSRQSDQRRILLKTLATQLIEHGELTTTRPKAKALKPYVERLVSAAVKGGLARRRAVIAQVDTIESVNRLFDVIAPQMKRTSGYLTHLAAPERAGDWAAMRTLKFVDPIEDIERQAKAPRLKPRAVKSVKSKSSPAKSRRSAVKTAAKKVAK